MRYFLSHWDRHSDKLGRSATQSAYHRKRAKARATQAGRALPGTVVMVGPVPAPRPAQIIPTR